MIQISFVMALCFMATISFGQSNGGALNKQELGALESASLIQHLSATVVESVTGSPVTEWADQSGHDNHAVAAAGSVYYPSTSLSAMGLAGLDFGSTPNSLELFSAEESDALLDFTGAASNNSGFAVLIAFKCDARYSGNDLVGNSTGVASGFGIRYSSGGVFSTYLGGVSISRSGATIEDGDSTVVALNYDVGAGAYTFWDSKNGSSVSKSVAPTNFSKSSAITLGRTTSRTRYFNGMVGEVKFYNASLSAEQLEQECIALERKWVKPETTLELGTVFQKNMVLQRDMNAPIWGTVAPGSNVVIKLDGVTVDTVTADENGKWMAHIGSYPHDGGEAHTVDVSTPGEPSISLSDVVFGDVYLASGQSNMYRPMSIVWGASEEAATANYPLIREIMISSNSKSLVPYENAVIAKNWRKCSPSTARGFSATAYFFAKNVYLNTGVPVGLLHASKGARQILHFIAPEGVAAIPEMVGVRQQMQDGPVPSNNNGVYSDLYNTMIAPLVPYGIRGFVWYQCEWDNRTDHDRRIYHQKMRALIAGWREVWGLGDLPFYYVQLTPWVDGFGAHTRQSQLWALSETNVGMAVSIDAGGFADLGDDRGHPKNKQDIGARLARWARRDIYHEDVVPSGPLFKDYTVEDSRIRVSFEYAEGLFAGTKYITNAVVATTEPLDNFEVAGADGVYHLADAEIDGPTVLVSSTNVPAPVHVRYCYANWPSEYNVKLYNSEALPASPFYSELEYGLNVIKGNGDGWYDEGQAVRITADAPSDGKVFDRWIGLPSGIEAPMSRSTTVTMPAHQTYLVATYRDSGEPTYTLTINQGKGGGPSKAGSFLAIMADAPPQGYLFSGWIGDTQAVHDVSSAYTTVTMPDSSISLTASYVLNGMSYTSWAGSNGVIGGPTGDDDGDGLDNFSEYAVGEKPTFSMSGSQFDFVYNQRNDDPSLSYEVQMTTNLISGPWTTRELSIVGTNFTGGFYDGITNRVSTDEPQTYIRIIIQGQ